MSKQINLSENLEKLREIAAWFDEQTQVDVEVGLKKVKEAAVLIKESKSRLAEIDNEFKEIQADIVSELDVDTEKTDHVATIAITKDGSDDSEEDDDIPF